MRLRIHFGQHTTKEVTWNKSFNDFPNIINYLGRNYEWVTYDQDPNGNMDFIFHFSELPPYDPNYNVYCPYWDTLFPIGEDTCECGAKFSSFEWDHMKFCRKWTPW